MATSIHPTAVVDPSATIGQDVTLGPYCVIEAGAVIGDACRLSSRVTIKAGALLGAGNVIDDGCVLGGMPQHIVQHRENGGLIVGSGNVIRENVTIHRAMTVGEATVIGDENLMMVNAHVAHDCRIGNRVIITNNVMLAGHVTVGDFAYLSGAVGVHQFCRIGAHCMVGGQAHIKKDVPPYVTVDGQTTRVVGLNLIGLRRRGFSSSDIRQLKEAYRIIYRQGWTWTEVLEHLRTAFDAGPAASFYTFLKDTRRGVLLERRTPHGATLPLHEPSVEEDATPRLKVG